MKSCKIKLFKHSIDRSDTLSQLIEYQLIYKVVDQSKGKSLLSRNGRPPYVGWFKDSDLTFLD